MLDTINLKALAIDDLRIIFLSGETRSISSSTGKIPNYDGRMVGKIILGHTYIHTHTHTPTHTHTHTHTHAHTPTDTNILTHR